MTEVSDILRSNAETFEAKTQDYGQSWRSQGEIISIMAHGEPIVLETKEEIVAFGLFTRRLDKLCREFYGTFFADEMNFEGPMDSAEDESVYAAMSAANLHDMAENANAETDGGEDEPLFEEVLAEMRENQRRREAQTESMNDVDHDGDFPSKVWLG